MVATATAAATAAATAIPHAARHGPNDLGLIGIFNTIDRDFHKKDIHAPDLFRQGNRQTPEHLIKPPALNFKMQDITHFFVQQLIFKSRIPFGPNPTTSSKETGSGVKSIIFSWIPASRSRVTFLNPSTFRFNSLMEFSSFPVSKIFLAPSTKNL